MLTTQLLSALILAVLGFAFGLAFDLYRVLRVISRPGKLVTAACDLLFWAAYTIWVFATLVKFNSGEVRFYVFLSLAVGGVVYFAWFSRSMLRGWYTIIQAIVSAATWLAEAVNRILDVVIAVVVWPYHVLNAYLLMPLYRVVRFIISPIFFLLRFLHNGAMRFLGFLLRPVRLLWGKVRRYLVALLHAPPEPPVNQ